MDIEKKFVDKIPVDKLYEDLFQPGLKKAGQALETVIEFGMTILLPVKLVNEKINLRFKKHLIAYNKKLDAVDEKKICQVPENIGLPILDKFTFLSQEDLADAFTNLLAKASSFDTVNLVHPSFLSTLDCLCGDEARILKHFKDSERIPVIDLYVDRSDEKIPKPDFYNSQGAKTRDQLMAQIDYQFQDRNTVSIKAAWNLTGIEKFVQLDFPENIYIYIDNLTRQGIISFQRSQYAATDAHIYAAFEESIYVQEIERLKKWTSQLQSTDQKSEFRIAKGFIEFTDYGKAFIKACIKA